MIARARAAFSAHFGREPRWFGVAPGRVNLMGDHVDYAGGLVLPMAIDRWTVAAADWSRDRRHPRLYAPDVGEAVELDLDASTEDRSQLLLGAQVGHWSGYIAGVFHWLRMEVGVGRDQHAIDLAITSSVPRASGLSSSAALELAAATAIDHAWGPEMSAEEFAIACQEAEHVGGGVQCGIMDQLASASGVAGHALIIDCADLSVTPSLISPGLSILVVDTRTPRRLSMGKYGELVHRLTRAKYGLSTTLRRVALDEIAATPTLDPEVRASAIHFVEENARVRTAAADLAAGNAVGLARSFAASHASLRDRLGVSCPELEAVVSVAAACGPDIGARLTGAGMGGCAVIVCPVERVDAVTGAVRDGFASAIGRECDVMRVCAVDGARSEG